MVYLGLLRYLSGVFVYFILVLTIEIFYTRSLSFDMSLTENHLAMCYDRMPSTRGTLRSSLPISYDGAQSRGMGRSPGHGNSTFFCQRNKGFYMSPIAPRHDILTFIGSGRGKGPQWTESPDYDAQRRNRCFLQLHFGLRQPSRITEFVGSLWFLERVRQDSVD